MNEARGGETAWDERELRKLIAALWKLRRAMLDAQARLEPALSAIDPAHRPSAINLSHYLAMRRSDLRRLQEGLAALGLSSLGRAETHALANVDKVLGILHRLDGRPWTPLSPNEPTGYGRGRALLERHADALFGAAPPERGVRIMVTLPSEAARDESAVSALVDAGMDIARINCAHDGAAEWVAMAAHVRRAAARAGRKVQVLMDLGGPKLRTGAFARSAAVLKIKPQRDELGQVRQAARLGLRAAGSKAVLADTAACVGVDGPWLARLALGDRIDLTDARAARRRLTVVECVEGGVVVAADRTIYLTAETELRLHRRDHEARKTRLSDLPESDARLLLQRGDLVHLVDSGLGEPAQQREGRARPAVVACTLPEVLPRLRKGERVWFDDGRIGGVVRRGGTHRVVVEITDARAGGEPLGADKGINLPDTRLDLPALTPKDLADLEVAARQADLIGLSFAQSADDVRCLRQRLVELGGGQLGLILKIETRRGFEHLPEMLLAAMTGPAAGVMIARGDLAVECGWERLAEVQEEILWACEAAHLPVVWATQVLETLARTGLPSRAEITDAAMGGRAECVMLNKGPHIVEAIHALDDILRRMRLHQSKKRPLLRALKAWSRPAPPQVLQQPAAAAPPAAPSRRQPVAA